VTRTNNTDLEKTEMGQPDGTQESGRTGADELTAQQMVGAVRTES
jgi:hypothetical protein